MNYIALAAAPGIAICIYIFYKDVYNKEPKLNLIISFMLGALTIIPAALMENWMALYVPIGSRWNAFVFAFLVVALTEEFWKLLALRVYSFRLKHFDEPFDGIVYSIMVSMGFATAENIFYVVQYAQVGQGYQVALTRMFTSVPAHATFGVMMGYFVGKAKFSQQQNYIILLGLLLATFFHGLYDFFLFLKEFSFADRHLSDGLLFVGAISSLILAIILSKKLIRLHRKLSANSFQMNIQAEKLTIQKATEAEISIIQKLAYEIWPNTYSSILSDEQLSYMLEKMYNEESLRHQMNDKTTFYIAYRDIEAVGFAGFTHQEFSVGKLDKLYVLPTEQGKGTGRLLIEKVTDLANSLGLQAIQLQVNRQNKAQLFYEKLGFKIIESADFDIGNGYEMNDYIMEKKL